MFDKTKPRASAGSASAFVAPTELRRSDFDIWAEAGRAIELAHRQPAPISQVVRIAVALALVMAAKLCSAGALR
jgi:hypothetical protein